MAVQKAERKAGLSWAWLAAVPALLVALFVYSPSDWSAVFFATKNPSVTIGQGTIVGRLVDDGTFPKPLEGFMGIPYALPPVNERRFRPAVPVPQGNGTLEAFYLGPRFVQPMMNYLPIE